MMLQSFTYLDVVVGVPVRVIDDDGICRSQIDAKASSSCREEESKLRSTGGCSDKKKKKRRVKIDGGRKKTRRPRQPSKESLTIKAVNSLLPHVASDSSINPLVLVAFILQEILQQVQHFGHLWEDQNPVATLLQLPHHLLEQHQLSWGLGQGVAFIHAIWKLGSLLQLKMKKQNWCCFHQQHASR